ncbi:hypothetical protein MMPV_008643 [Pyropia vietnamensis]
MGMATPAATTIAHRRAPPAFATPVAVGRRPAPVGRAVRGGDSGGDGGGGGGGASALPRLSGGILPRRKRRPLVVASSSVPPPRPPASSPSPSQATVNVPSPIPLTSRRGLPAVAAGAVILAALGINRVWFTPPPPAATNPRGPTAPSPQARSDLLGVAAAATSILHGLASADVVARETTVELRGVDVPPEGVGPVFGPAGGGSDGDGLRLATWVASAVTTAIPSVVSVTVVVGGRLAFRAGLFPPTVASETAAVVDGGDGGGSDGSSAGGGLGSVVGSDIVARAVASRTRAYLADTKSVPRADVEFGWLPRGTPAVVVVPFGGGYGSGGGEVRAGDERGGGVGRGDASASGALVLAASRTRPLTGVDFGWLQALADRLGQAVEAAGEE